jgi:hypothetical protein
MTECLWEHGVLFLDFDGVLNGLDWCWAVPGRMDRSDYADMINPENVAHLNTIVQETGVVVVVSSAWRIIHRLPELRDFLRRRGFVGTVVDRTESLGERHQEIRWYAAREHVERWVAIDDALMPELGDKIVQTAPRLGLTAEDAERAIAILRSQEISP